MLTLIQPKINYNYNFSHKSEVKPHYEKNNVMPLRKLAACPRPYFGNKFVNSVPNKAFTEFLSTYVFDDTDDLYLKDSTNYIFEYIKNDSSPFKGIVGDVPPEWIEKINTTNKKQQLFKALGSFAENIRTIYPYKATKEKKYEENDKELKKNYPEIFSAKKKNSKN